MAASTTPGNTPGTTPTRAAGTLARSQSEVQPLITVTPSPQDRNGRPRSASQPRAGISGRSTSPGGRYGLGGRVLARRAVGMTKYPNSGDSMDQSASDFPGPPTEAFVSPMSMSMSVSQLGLFAEKVNNTLADAQRRRDSDRRTADRRLQQLESKVDSLGDNRELRKKYAEINGSVTGLHEELQMMARRIDGVEKNLSTRTGGLEAMRQRSQEIEQIIQQVEQSYQSSRLTAASSEESRKREANRVRHIEKNLDDLSRRFLKTEESLQSHPRDTSGLNRLLREHQQEGESVRHRLEWLEEELIKSDIQNRVSWLEETMSSNGAPKLQHASQDAQLNDDYSMTERVSCMEQRTASNDRALVVLQQQMQDLRLREHDDHSGSSGISPSILNLQKEVGAMSHQIAENHARLIDLEGNMEFGSDHCGSANGPGSWQSQLDEVMSEQVRMRQLLSQMSLSAPPRDDSNPVGSEASPQRGRPEHGDAQHYPWKVHVETRLQELEERNELCWTYTQTYVADHSGQLRQLGDRVIYLEDFLQDADHASPSDSPGNAVHMRNDRGEASPSHDGEATMMAAQGGRPQFDEIYQRLYAVEDRIEGHDEKILQQVSTGIQQHRHEIEETISDLTARVAMVEGQAQVGSSVASLCKELQLQNGAFHDMDDDNLELMEIALQQMQVNCLSCSNQIATSVQSELRRLCGDDDSAILLQKELLGSPSSAQAVVTPVELS